MTTILAFIFVLGVIVIIHELGHFFAARSVGVRVDRFSIGFPPRLFTVNSVDGGFEINLFFYKKNDMNKISWEIIKTWNINIPERKGSGTEYCFAIVPLGGYVKLAGMIDESMDGTIQNEPHELMSKPVWAQIWVMSAGVIMNILLAFVIFTSLAWYQGVPTSEDKPVIYSVEEDSPADNANLISGDKIIKVNDYNISTWSDLSSAIQEKPNESINITYARGGQESSVDIYTTFRVFPIDGKLDTLGMIGIAPELIYKPIGIIRASQLGVTSTVGGLGLVVLSIKLLISGQASMGDLGGPILIAQIAGETARAGLISLFGFMAIISCNLAFINFLPIPGLDGGHVFIILAESLLRRKFTLKTRMIIQQIGMAFLLLLMATVMINDIGRLFTN
ncbi:MAG: RIP metalloprotease RseP [Candidatus Neomarinimicrobiota bacterium]|nr:MAG: RIP metalloprotease RseP [bacterium]|tara:strand:+ start:1675 stop:2850 length:1176 start_codon:yes stop_codon:yes gene_type:complete